MKKIFMLFLASFMLGGCTLIPRSDRAATDMASPVPTITPTPTLDPDPELGAMASPTTQDDTASITTDLNSTVILDEDFSDLE